MSRPLAENEEFVLPPGGNHFTRVAARPNSQGKPNAPERDTVRREIDRIARQLDGLSKSLKRLKEAT